ncbi:hypothetical protein H7H48_15745 [Nitratireductor sp. B36]|uniref:hypothetical protein n=1 Tax=Nitratireductor sp. B36 TaxID=2762059 RepID=UPI001E32AA26|nr:hypothetical protein [Nitratireductor sp. B36]MCC5780514.1 hypothetical protein [Nitratireductor sp. B36]
MTNRIAVHMEGQEGALHIDGLTGQIVTPNQERPEWADGYAVALLAERIGWYEQRLGHQLPEAIRKPQLLTAQDLGWIGVDAEGDEVEIEANAEHRMELLAGYLGIDRTDFDQERNFAGAIAQADVDHTYVTQATDEATLEQVEGQGFSETQKKAING